MPSRAYRCWSHCWSHCWPHCWWLCRSLGRWLCCCVLLVGCVQQMADQARLESQELHAGVSDIHRWRAAPLHTVPARESKAHDEPRFGDMSAAELRRLLTRGRERYAIHCVPCHDSTGSGNGMAARRGMAHPPSYHTSRLRAKPIEDIFAVATNGRGAMPAYGELVSDSDRWAIAAYVRALQFSQFAALEQLSHQDRAALDETDRASAQPRPTRNASTRQSSKQEAFTPDAEVAK